ncbi:SLC13 family permease [Aliiruegeria sabulilitoris]|uniref:SLC13 family permease n=1 Tax=Aliiruegeria sabulilitoris TaxID=1510458 RepID=UPI000835B160|nr:SLC13 family permease [Aliiruegeria sabulilitoris]NDR55037.1 SLC13 family permease [Pseudoruegeria sp. M32A2M]
MPSDQTLIFLIFAAVFVLLIHGRVRYDLVAFAALVVATALGLVPVDGMFSGFAHPAVAIIALVLIVSRGLMSSGAVELLSAHLIDNERPVPLHIAAMATVGAALSAVINNVAALSLLMPLDMEAARKAKRAAGRTLMPLSFATILGGMVTLIGTPPNIVIAGYRQDALGEPFGMLDFAPVGLAVSVAGVAFVALVGWRLLPRREGAGAFVSEAAQGRYVAELRVGEKAADGDTMVGELYPLAEELDLNILGLVRSGRRRPGFAAREPIRPGDFIVVEGDPKAIETFMGQAALDFVGSENHKGGVASESLTLAEAIVPEGARIAGRTARSLRLLHGHSVTLLGVARNGQRFHDRVRLLTIRPGDVLLLLGTPERIAAATNWLGVLPLEGRRTAVMQRSKAGLALGIFGLAILLAVAGIAPLLLALAGCVVAYAALGLVGGREVYEAVEWKVIVLLASLIPLADAFERSGGAELIAGSIVGVTGGWPAWSTLLVLMVVTMTLSDFLNNVATTLIAAPIGVGLAQATGTNPDAFLMGVAVAASCAFLTPIGHKNNTIILGPGGYRFGDYWRMGLPLELLVLAVALPVILVVWPL